MGSRLGRALGLLEGLGAVHSLRLIGPWGRFWSSRSGRGIYARTPGSRKRRGFSRWWKSCRDGSRRRRLRRRRKEKPHRVEPVESGIGVITAREFTRMLVDNRDRTPNRCKHRIHAEQLAQPSFMVCLKAYPTQPATQSFNSDPRETLLFFLRRRVAVILIDRRKAYNSSAAFIRQLPTKRRKGYIANKRLSALKQ